MSVGTQVFKVADGFVRRSRVDDFSFVHECEVIKLPEDGVAGLVNGEDDGLALFGEPGKQTVCVKNRVVKYKINLKIQYVQTESKHDIVKWNVVRMHFYHLK